MSQVILLGSRLDINLSRGADGSFQWYETSDVDGTATVWTGWTPSLHVRPGTLETPSQNPAQRIDLSSNCSVIDDGILGAGTVVQVNFTAAINAANFVVNLPYCYSLVMIPVSGLNREILRGNIMPSEGI